MMQRVETLFRSTGLFGALTLAALVALSACAGGTAGDGDGDGDGDRTAYPEGPYGLEEGDVLEAHTFTSPDGETFAIEDIFLDTDNKLLLMATAAEWCSVCRDEQPLLQDFQDTYGSDGLQVVVAVIESDPGIVATPAVADAWKEQYELSVPVVADEESHLANYYDTDQTPMNMIVDLDTMEIVRIIIGADASSVEAIIEAKL